MFAKLLRITPCTFSYNLRAFVFQYEKTTAYKLTRNRSAERTLNNVTHYNRAKFFSPSAMSLYIMHEAL